LVDYQLENGKTFMDLSSTMSGGGKALAVVLLAGLTGLAVTLAPTGTARAASKSTPALVPCHLEHLAEEVRCGTHEVFENRETNSGRRLSIQFAVLEPLRRTHEPDPLFIMAGGPGQGARSFAGIAGRYFKKVRRTREIVLVDLRGTGESNPLACKAGEDALASLSSLLGGADMAARCAKSLDADPRRYTHKEALADLDEIRRRLGYERINLWGGSWGTRAALLYAATYPDAVRSVVLDGAVPLDMAFPLSLAQDTEQAMDLLMAGCAADAGCAAVYPNPREDFHQLLERLERKPLIVQAVHPQTGAAITVTLGREALAEIVRVALYTPGDASRVLRILAHASAGDFEPLFAQVVRSASTSTDEMALGATLSILCSEDMPLVRDADFEAAGRGTFVRSSYGDAWRSRCGSWPRGEALTLDQGVRLAIPALILSGGHDPVTPARWGERMGRHFPNHQHVVVPGAAHNASFSGCVPDLIAEFITRGSADQLDASCARKVAWPPIVVSDAGARP
jgi:pimeloyl-ACP methyl ester carboxylesterase